MWSFVTRQKKWQCTGDRGPRKASFSITGTTFRFWKRNLVHWIMRCRLESNSEQAGEGTREYIRVLRLLENHSVAKLGQAIEKALRIGASSRDAISLFLFPQQPWQHTTFRLDGREHLRYVKVAQVDISVYGQVLSEKGAV